MEIRLNKFLADHGIASRRKAERFILQGKVKINSEVVAKLATKVDPKTDLVEVQGYGVLSEKNKEKVIYKVNKPVGYICSNRRFKNDKLVFDLIDDKRRLFVIGRLDKDSQGLVLLTNDGNLAQKMTHPRYEKEKEYEVEVDKELTKDFLAKMASGVRIDSGLTRQAKVKPLAKKSFNIILKQGKNRQIRKMCAKLGYKVQKLKRIRLGSVELGDLRIGSVEKLEWRLFDKILTT